ncbi:MAG TPA: ribulose-phosphate 3-epimerase [Bacillota bacterium]|nr:ribulose-phosphate 3-epimerase [Bacillota bacterium]
MIVSPSFLTADFMNLEAEIRSISFSQWLHFDVMDGRFVPAYTYNQEIVRMAKSISRQYFDVHLMIEEPEKAVAAYAEAGADLITFHLEAAADPGVLIRQIKGMDVACGISIKPGTAVEELLPWIDQVDLVLVMSVEPGKGGQAFLKNALDRIRFLADYRKANGLKYWIEVDGGINRTTIAGVKEAGADVVVAGSFIFSRTDRKAAIMELENA